MPGSFWLMIALLGVAGIAFVPVVIWIESRTKEREAHFRNDTLRKILESGDARPAIEFLREVEKAEGARVREKTRLAGLINIAAGFGLLIFLYMLVPEQAVYLVGLIPLFVGIALLIGGRLTRDRDALSSLDGR